MNLIESFSGQLKSNIIQTSEGAFLQAGNNQFQSFWTRDFCFASFGLVAIKEYSVVKNHLQKLLDHMNNDGLIPRILETHSSAFTVVINTVFRFLPRILKKSSHKKNIKAEHLGEHGTLSIDSNALVILAALNYVEVSSDKEFLEKNREKLLKCFLFYKTRINDGLVYQKEFEDWQDSSKRAGKTFYTNLLYFQTVKKLSQHKLIQSDLASIKKKIQENFKLDFGLYRTINAGHVISTEANYLAIIWDFCENPEAVYQALEEYQIKRLPICSYPHYAKNEISWTTKMVGLSHYHDEMLWSWIIGLKLMAAKKLNKMDDKKYLVTKLIQFDKRDGALSEIYHPKTQKLFKNILYKSESPFSWGLGICLWALLYKNPNNNKL